MWYIVIILVVIGLIVTLGKYVLFDPRINSVLCIVTKCMQIGLIISGYAVANKLWLGVFLVLSPIIIISCIRDIVIAKKYYGNIEYGVDPLYRVKSLTSIFTYGISRVVFLLIVDPYIYYSARSDLEKDLNRDRIIPYQDGQSTDNGSFIKRHFYRQYSMRYYEFANAKLASGEVLSNQWVIDAESQMSQNKLEKSYPKTFLEKAGEMFSDEGKEAKAGRENAEKEIPSIRTLKAYVDTGFYNQCKLEMSEALKTRGTLSPHNIAKLEELKCLNIFKNKNIFKIYNWIEYYVIFVMSSLVKEGIVEEFDLNDKNILENHQYKHIMGVPMRSRNAEDNPLLALDDD